MISLDTETTGVDLRHSAKPFLVTICKEDGEQLVWEFDVDPYTREPIDSNEDREEITQLLREADSYVLQNAKFDVTALASIDIVDWQWAKTHDTLIAGHLLASNKPHNLTDMAIQYLGVDIEPYEKRLEEAAKSARRYVTSHYPDWKIAKSGLEGMPSAKEKTWKYDTWLPRMVCVLEGRLETDPWYTVTRDYANTDSATTLMLWKVMRQELERRGLWEIYIERMKMLPIAYEMEQNGVTLSKTRLDELRDKYRKDSYEAEETCIGIAKGLGYELTLPKSGNNKSLSTFLFGDEHEGIKPVLDLPIYNWTDKGNASLDKATLDSYEQNLPEGNKLEFVKALKAKRKRDTAIAYMEGYERYWRPMSLEGELYQRAHGFYKLHPSLNPTGTDTLRWSSNHPNEQNISKQEGFNLRYCFGPAPGREWWSLDAKNLELRIPAYEADEKDLIYIFEHPDDAPYYGSYHLLVFDLLHPKEFAEHGKKCKELYESTLYQWIKNGNFSIVYGAQEEKADATYRVVGAYKRVRYRFPKIAQLADRQIAYANKYGYVETIPDRKVSPAKGYPILCTRTEWGKIMPTVPLNYHIQSTAMWWTMIAMNECYPQLQYWSKLYYSHNFYMTMQVHDELVFDMPRGAELEPWKTNLPKIRKIQSLMESCGERIGVPTPVGIEYHADNWSEGRVLA